MSLKIIKLIESYFNNKMTDFNTNLNLFLNTIKNSPNNNTNIIIIDYPDFHLKLIHTSKLNQDLHHSNNLLDFVIHSIDFIVIDDKYNLLFYVKKNILLNSTNVNTLIDNWKDCNVYTNYIGNYTIFFIHNNTKFYSYKYNIKLFENSNISTFINSEIFTDKPVHKIVYYYKNKHIVCFNNHNIIDKKVYSLDEKIHNFNNYDDLEDEFYKNIKYQEEYKKLTDAGYIICYKENNYVLLNTIYSKIINLLPNYTNITKIFLDLYKNDLLNQVINYMSIYPQDIIKRINLSVKTVSKEYLNIYHLTRKKGNPQLYEKLNMYDKKILYDLHTIFINTRKNEYIINEEFADKKSLNVDIVYKYIKNINIDILEQIYLNRDELMLNTKNILQDKNFKIYFEDCINTKTITYLLNK